MITEKDIVEILQGYFYMTVDTVEYNSGSRDNYNQNVARIYSQREIETDETWMNDKLREELTQEFRDIAKEILGKIKEEKHKIEINETLNGRTIFKD